MSLARSIRPWKSGSTSPWQSLRRWAAVGLAASAVGLAAPAPPRAAAQEPRPLPESRPETRLAQPQVAQPTGAGTPNAGVQSTGPRIADREALHVRVVNRPHGGRGGSRNAPWDVVETTPASQPRPTPDSPPAKDESFRVREYDVTIAEKSIGLSILRSATSDDVDDATNSGRTPPNYAKEIIANSPVINVENASRYREDFVLPVDLAASEFCYRPLYFEEVNLERYGTAHGLWQPILSGAHFFATVPAMPYLATVKRPCVARYWPHQFPAGRRAPVWEPEGPPFDLEAAGIEGLAVYGLILLIP